MRLHVLGSNGMYPTAGGPGSGYLVTGGATTVMLDAGPGTVVALQSTGGARAVDAVVISHIHPDHCSDLFALFNVHRYGPGGRRRIPLFAPEGAVERLAGFIHADAGHELFSVFDFRTVDRGESAAVGDIRLAFGEAVHSVPALVTAIDHEGRRLVYTGDTGPGGDTVETSRGAAVLLVEATYQGTPGADRWPFHLFASEAGEIAAAAGVEHLVLTHIDPALDPQRSIAEASATFGGSVSWAAPGWEITV